MGWLTGWNYKKEVPIASSGWSLSGNVTDRLFDLKIGAGETAFWAGVKADGGDIRVTSSDGTTLLYKVTVVFDNTNDFCHIKVKIPSITSATDTTLYLYYGNAAATSDDDLANAIGSSFKINMPLDLNYSGGAFADLSPSANNGTNNGTTDVAGQIGRGRAFARASSQDISVADSDSLSFGNATTDSPFTVAFTVKLTDATGSWVVGKNETTNREYVIGFNGSDKLQFVLYDQVNTVNINTASDSTFTADEGSFIRCVGTYDGNSLNSGLNLYRNGTLLASTDGSAGTYVAMHNHAINMGIGSLAVGLSGFLDGALDEIVVYAGEWTADQIIVDYQSNFGTITFGAEIHFDATPDSVNASFSVPAPTITTTTFVLPDTITASFTIPAPTVGTGWTVFPDPVTGTFSVPVPAVSGVIIVSPDPVTGSFSIPAPDIQKVIVLPTAVTGSFTIPEPSVVLPTIVLVNAVTGAFAILAPDITEIVAVMMGVSNFPQGATVEYKITDSDGVELQAWTSVGVNEVQGPSKSAYYVKTNVIGGGIESRGIIYWRTSDLAYEASDVFDTSQSNIATLLQRLTYNRAANLDNLDAAISTRPTVTEIWDEVLTKATHNVANSAGKRLRQLSASFVHDGTAQAGGTNTITLDTGASATDYIYNEGLIVIVGGTAQGETHHIMSYNGTTKVAVVDQNWYTQPDNTSDFVIFGSSAHDTIATGLAAGGGASTITLNGDASTIDDTYIGCYIAIPSGTGAGQARRVTGYNGTTKVATVTDAWATAPDNTSVYMAYPSSSTPTLSEIEGSSVLAKEATLSTIDTIVTLLRKHATNKMVEVDGGATKTFTIYDNDNVTPILTYTYTVDATTRNKATE